ncbi:MAG: hypothetical protein PVI35_06440, partial [Acidimicrobiia bacterium]
DQLTRALDAAAPPVDDAGVWERLQPRVRRARRLHRIQLGLATTAAVAAVATAGVIAAAAIGPRDQGPITGTPADVTTTTTATTTTTTAPKPADLPVDGAIDTVDGWLRAIASGDATAAWNLLSASSRDAVGRTAWDAIAAEMEEGFGSWYRADPTMRAIAVDIGAPPAAIVTLHGTRTVEGIVETSSTVFATVFEDGAWKLEWYAPDPDVVTEPRPESSAFFSSSGPVEWTGTGDGVNLLLLDGDVVAVDEREGDGTVSLSWVPPAPLPPGIHIVTAVVAHRGGPVTVAAVPAVIAATG